MSTATSALDTYVAVLIRRTMKTGREPFPGEIAVTNVRTPKPGTHVADVAATYGGVTVHYRARLASGRVTITRVPKESSR